MVSTVCCTVSTTSDFCLCSGLEHMLACSCSFLLYLLLLLFATATHLGPCNLHLPPAWKPLEMEVTTIPPPHLASPWQICYIWCDISDVSCGTDNEWLGWWGFVDSISCQEHLQSPVQSALQVLVMSWWFRLANQLSWCYGSPNSQLIMKATIALWVPVCKPQWSTDCKGLQSAIFGDFQPQWSADHSCEINRFSDVTAISDDWEICCS